MSLPNIWHLRQVASTAAKACYVCYKPSSSVLVTPDNKDFFYICPVHLKDRGFCSPIIDPEQEAVKRRQEAIAAEVEKVKQEYEERQKKKGSKSQEKEKGKESGGSEVTDEKGGVDSKEAGKADNATRTDISEGTNKPAATGPKADDSPRIFALHKAFYQMRIDRIRRMEMARRNRERLKDPTAFPSVPTRDP